MQAERRCRDVGGSSKSLLSCLAARRFETCSALLNRVRGVQSNVSQDVLRSAIDLFDWIEPWKLGVLSRVHRDEQSDTCIRAPRVCEVMRQLTAAALAERRPYCSWAWLGGNVQ